MASALQPPVGGLPKSTQPRRTFAQILASSSNTHPSHGAQPNLSTTIEQSPTGTHKGDPAIFFTPTQVNTLAQPFRWSLIGKFSRGYNKTDPKTGRPSLEDLQQYFVSLDLKGQFSIGLLDNRHLLIHLAVEEDYLRLYSRMIWHLSPVTMRIFKWDTQFHVDRESSIVPLWITMPRLPIHFFAKSALFQIASLVGTPLRMDAATEALKRPSTARIQIEVDLLKSRPAKVWIGVGEREGFWQQIEYENVPNYCTHCWHVGHSESICRVQNLELSIIVHDRQNSNPAPKLKQVFVPKQSDDATTSTQPGMNSSDNNLEVMTIAASPAKASTIGLGLQSVTLEQPDAVKIYHMEAPTSGLQSPTVRIAAAPAQMVEVPDSRTQTEYNTMQLVSQEVGFPAKPVIEIPAIVNQTIIAPRIPLSSRSLDMQDTSGVDKGIESVTTTIQPDSQLASPLSGNRQLQQPTQQPIEEHQKSLESDDQQGKNDNVVYALNLVEKPVTMGSDETLGFDKNPVNTEHAIDICTNANEEHSAMVAQRAASAEVQNADGLEANKFNSAPEIAAENCNRARTAKMSNSDPEDCDGGRDESSTMVSQEMMLPNEVEMLGTNLSTLLVDKSTSAEDSSTKNTCGKDYQEDQPLEMEDIHQNSHVSATANNVILGQMPPTIEAEPTLRRVQFFPPQADPILRRVQSSECIISLESIFATKRYAPRPLAANEPEVETTAEVPITIEKNDDEGFQLVKQKKRGRLRKNKD